MSKLGFSSSMLWAWAWLAIYLLGLTVFSTAGTAEGKNFAGIVETSPLMYIAAIINSGILIYLIKTVRQQTSDHIETINTPGLNTWGYLWRGFVLYFLQIPLFFVILFVLPLNLNVNKFDAGPILISEIIFIVTSAVCAWTLFSKDRRNQVRKMFATFRGY